MSIDVASATNQYLTFRLSDEQYAADVGKVLEVLEFTTITRVPRTPAFMRGVINLRGSVVPVIDLRMKFGMTKTEKTVNTCIIVMEIRANEETIVLGVLADSVQEVIELDSDGIEPAPRIGIRLNTDFLHGMAKRDDQFIMILNTDRVFTTEELSNVVPGDEKVSTEGEEDTVNGA